MKNNYRYITSWFIALFLIPLSLFSQHDLTMYNTPLVPQRIYQNPAFIPGQRVYVGIPFLSGVRMAYANPFSYNDVLTKAEGDSLNLEVDNFISKISRDNRLQTSKSSISCRPAQRSLPEGISSISVSGSVRRSRRTSPRNLSPCSGRVMPLPGYMANI